MKGKELNNFIFVKTDNGYSRYIMAYSNNAYIYKVLTNKSNRSILKKICYYVICKLLKHIPTNIVIEKGFDKEKYGIYFISMCDRCRETVIFYEGVEIFYEGVDKNER